MKNSRLAKILFFIADCAPTVEDYEAAEALNANVVFRNGSAVGENERPEACDGVAGKVPKAYESLPTADEAIAAKKAEYETRLSAIGDEQPANVNEAETQTKAAKAWGAKKGA